MNTGIAHALTSFVCMLQILLILDRSARTEYQETIDVPFCGMLGVFALFCLTDSARGLLSGTALRAPGGVVIAASYGCYLAMALSANVGIGYGLSCVKAGKRDRRILFVCRAALLALQLIILAYNLKSHDAFWVNAEGVYVTGFLRSYLYCLQIALYGLLMLYTAFRWVREKSKQLYRNTFLFACIPCVFGAAQYLLRDAAMYALGFSLAAFMLYTFKVSVRREEFMKDSMSGRDRMQTSIIHALSANYAAIYYVDLTTDEFEVYRNSFEGNGLVKEKGRHRNYFQSVVEHGTSMVLPEDQEFFRKSLSKEQVLRKLEQKGSYSFKLRIRLGGSVQYFRYHFTRPTLKEEGDKLIVGVYNLEKEMQSELEMREQTRLAAEREEVLKEKADRLSQDACTDALTGLYNRREYENDIRIYGEKQLGKNFVYLSVDLNGLKTANDSMGHEAGDELLRAAAFCLRTCFGSNGKVYRTGGDEFVAMFYADHDKLYEILTDFDRTVQSWSGERIKELTVSYGFVAKEENSGLTISEMAKLADKRMYQDKEDYYLNRGIDRKGRHAFRASAFKRNNPRFPEFCRAVMKKGIGEDCVVELAVTTLDGEKNETSIRVQESDLELLRGLASMAPEQDERKDGTE